MTEPSGPFGLDFDYLDALENGGILPPVKGMTSQKLVDEGMMLSIVAEFAAMSGLSTDECSSRLEEISDELASRDGPTPLPTIVQNRDPD